MNINFHNEIETPRLKGASTEANWRSENAVTLNNQYSIIAIIVNSKSFSKDLFSDYYGWVITRELQIISNTNYHTGEKQKRSLNKRTKDLISFSLFRQDYSVRDFGNKVSENAHEFPHKKIFLGRFLMEFLIHEYTPEVSTGAQSVVDRENLLSTTDKNQCKVVLTQTKKYHLPLGVPGNELLIDIVMGAASRSLCDNINQNDSIKSLYGSEINLLNVTATYTQI